MQQLLITLLTYHPIHAYFAGVTAKSTPGKARTGAAAGLNTTANTAHSTHKPIHKALSEKGWVSQLKPTAHNYHLKNLQNASVAAVEV